MREHHREMTHLRKFIAHDDTTERHEVEAKVTQAERDERCVRRAIWLMVVLAALAAVGLGYAAVLLEDYPQNLPRFFTHYMVKGSCALGLASLVSLICFVGLWTLYRNALHDRREECRQLAAKVVESRLGRPATLPTSTLLNRQEVPLPQSQTAPSE